MTIARMPVRSSNVKSVGHDPKSNTLQVEFHNGGVYEYKDVPASAHQAFVNARSVGGHFHAHIRDQYEDEKIA
jgi:hypothetical protein